MKRTTVVSALLLMGFTGISAQVILIRDLIITFSGNELTIGIFLANWLIAEACGSYMAGHFEYRIKNPVIFYSGLQWSIALLLPLSLYATRIIKSSLYSVPGEVNALTTIIFLSLLMLLPIGIAGGAQFSIGTRILKITESENPMLSAQIYRYEAIGSLTGGFAVSYLFLTILDSDQSVYLIAMLNVLSAILLFRSEAEMNQESLFKKHKKIKIMSGGLMITLLLLSLSGNISSIQKITVQQRWPEHDLVSTENSIYGNVTLLKRAGQFELMANGLPVASFPLPDIASTEDLVHFALLSHPEPKEILLIGGASRIILGEILKHQVLHIDYVEIDPLIIQIQKKYITAKNDYLTGSPKVTAHFMDGRYFLKNEQKKYDVILLNLPDPSTLELNRFYTHEFFTICAENLTGDGILLFHLPGSDSYMNRELVRLHKCLLQTITDKFPYQMVIPDLQTLIIASGNPMISDSDPELLISRWQKRQIEARTFSAPYIRYKLDKSRQIWYRDQLNDSPQVRTNKDLYPSALYYNLIYINSQQSPGFASFYQALQSLALPVILVLVLVFTLIILFLNRKFISCSNLPVFYSIMTSGFSGMGLTVLMVLLFQSLYGYIYFWIGLILASFMAGLAWGSSHAGRTDIRTLKTRNGFQRTEAGFVFYFFILFMIILIFRYLLPTGIQSPWPQIIILVFTLICGFIVGFQFPLATNIYTKHIQFQARAAGTIYAADLAGAWSAGLIITLFTIPILGTLQTVLFLFLLKISSTLIFYFSKST